MLFASTITPRGLTMSRFRNYWLYSAGLAIAWAIVLTIFLAAKPASAHNVLLAFLGFVIGWVSTTIARYVYPPAKRWQTSAPPRTDAH